MNTNTRVVVLGGGYAGTTAANRLRRDPGVDVTLVNARPRFVERIRLHQLVAGTHTATVDYGTLLGDGVRLVVGDAVHIDATAREVVTAGASGATGEKTGASGATGEKTGASGATGEKTGASEATGNTTGVSDGRVPYDHLVYAVGSTAAAPTVPGAAEHAWSLADLEAARRLRDVVDSAAGPLTVVGGGLTGIEVASELAGGGSVVRLVCGGVLGPSLSLRGRRSVARWCAGHGVDVLEAATVAEVGPDTVVLDDGTVLPSAVTVWTAGFEVPALARRSGLSTDALGRLLTDETLTSVDHDRIVAAGDAAAPSGRPLRMSCQAAGPLGAQAAETVLARIAGTAPAPLDQAFAGQCLSLGRHGSTIQLARRDDTPVEVVVAGRAGAALKEAICRGTLWSIRREARRPGSAVWLRGGRRIEQGTSP